MIAIKVFNTITTGDRVGDITANEDGSFSIRMDNGEMVPPDAIEVVCDTDTRRIAEQHLAGVTGIGHVLAVLRNPLASCADIMPYLV